MPDHDYVIKITADPSQAIDAFEKVKQVAEETKSKAGNITPAMSDASDAVQRMAPAMDKAQSLGDALASEAGTIASAMKASTDTVQAMSSSMVNVRDILEPLGESFKDEISGAESQLGKLSAVLTSTQQGLTESQARVTEMANRVKTALVTMDSNAPKGRHTELVALANRLDQINLMYSRQAVNLAKVQDHVNDMSMAVTNLGRKQEDIMSRAQNGVDGLEAKLTRLRTSAMDAQLQGKTPSKSLLNEIAIVEARIKDMRAHMQNGDFSKVIGWNGYETRLRNVMKTLGQLTESVTKSADALGMADTKALNYAQRVQSITPAQPADRQAMSETVTSSSEKLSKLSEAFAKVDEDISKSSANVMSMISRVKNALDGLGSNAPKYRTRELSSASNVLYRMASQYDAQKASVEALRTALKGVESDLQRLDGAQATIVSNAEGELAKLEEQLASAMRRVDVETQSGVKPSAGLLTNIEDLKRRIGVIKDSLATGNYQNLAGWSEYEKGVGKANAKLVALSNALTKTTTALGAQDAKVQAYGKHVDVVAPSTLPARLQALANGFKHVTKEIGKMHIFSSVMKTVSSSISRMLSAFPKLGQSMAGFTNRTTTAKKTINALSKSFLSFTRLAILRLKRMAITAIFKDIGQTSGQIAHISTDYNTAISKIVNSTQVLGAQIVAIAEPIISTLGPALSRVIDLLASAADTASQFMARLSGRDTYIKATKGLYDYATATDEASKKTKSSAKRASDATKALAGSLMSFDELHRLDDRDGSASSADDDDASSLTGMTDAQLSKASTQATAFNELADKLRDAWKRGDFRGVGILGASQVGKAFEWLRNVAGWSANSELFTQVLTNIADAVNGFFFGLNSGQIGTAIADLGNTLVNGVYVLLTSIDPAQIGTKLGNIIVSFASNFDWDIAGRNLVAGFQFVIDMGTAFLRTDALAEIGTGIGEFFAGVADEFTPEKWGSFFSSAINGIASFLSESFNPETFAELGYKFATAVNVMFEGLDAEEVSSGINAFVESITSFINTALDQLDLSAIASKIVEIGSKLNWGSIFEVIAIVALPALIPAVLGLVAKGIGAALMASGSAIPVLIASIIGAVIAALALNWERIKAWADQAWERIKAWGKKVADFFGKIFAPIADVASSVGGAVADFGKSLASGASGAFSWLGDRLLDARRAVTFSWEDDERQQAEQNQSGVSAPWNTNPVTMDEYYYAMGLDNEQTADYSPILSTIQTATENVASRIIASLGQSSDIVINVDSEVLGRAAIRGLATADRRASAGYMQFA